MRRARLALLPVTAALLACRGPSGGMPNLPLPTLGGKQLWSDVAWRDGWRVQQHAWTGHCRLLDPRDRRRAWGGREACQRALPAPSQALAAPHLVVLLHGLGRSRASMSRLRRALEADGHRVAALSYASTRGSVAEHAARLEGLLDRIDGSRQVSFVTHSLGGLVARATLARAGAWSARMPAARLVMIAPPSRGSALASQVLALPPLAWLLGPALRDCTPPGAGAIPLPSCPFLVIAGGRGNDRGLCPLVSGDDDLVVGVEEARLDGGGFLRVRGIHTLMPAHPEAVDAARRFLRDLAP